MGVCACVSASALYVCVCVCAYGGDGSGGGRVSACVCTYACPSLLGCVRMCVSVSVCRWACACVCLKVYLAPSALYVKGRYVTERSSPGEDKRNPLNDRIFPSTDSTFYFCFARF